MKSSILSALILMLSVPGIAGAGPGPKAAAGPQRYWYDGETKRDLREEPGSAVQFGASETDEEALTSAGFSRAGLRGKARLWKRASAAVTGRIAPEASAIPASAGKTSPAFRGEDNALRALPGGIVVKFRDHWTDADAGEWAARNGLTLLRKLPLRGVWSVKAEPGLPSLELANRLHETGEVEWASPDWWREISKK